MPNIQGMTVRLNVVPSEDAVWSEVKGLKGSADFFANQGDAHGEIDCKLQEDIEGLLVPILGSWEQSDAWFHNQDFYGDGVRCLTFRENVFPWSTVASLQKLLANQCSRFCIVVHISSDLGVNSRWLGTMAIVEQEVLGTPYIAEILQRHFDGDT